jgi:hypothetical protein
MLLHCVTRREVPGSTPGRILGCFRLTYYFYPLSVTKGCTQPVTDMSTKEFSWV